VLGFKSKNLVVGLLRDSLALVGGGIELFGLLVAYLDVFVVSVIDSDLIFHFLPHDINLLS